MNFSRPSLHPKAISTPEHFKIVTNAIDDVLAKRQRLTTNIVVDEVVTSQIDIPLTTVSLNTNFDAYINVGFKGGTASSRATLVVDLGNSTLIMPRLEDLQSLPNFSSDYKIVAADVPEPWGCPASIVRGPIEISTKTGMSFTIPNCMFFVCKADNSENERTANFGIGSVTPWFSENGTTIQAPLTYQSMYSFLEVNYAPAKTVLSATVGQPNVATKIYLTLYKSSPPGYTMCDIIRDKGWMALKPKSLTIAGDKTMWPGDASSVIAMIDTGGGPAYLSDPRGYLYKKVWPGQVSCPSWTSPDSVSCQAINDAVKIEIGDAHSSFSYVIDTSAMPAPVQNLTLVICEMCSYMMGQQGMNIGGISSLFNLTLIDYAHNKVGFKPK